MTPRDKKKLEIEDKKSHDYELVLIINPEVVDDALEAVVNSVSQFITGKKGIISSVDQWGKKRLAYPIKQFLEGNYVLTRFTMNPAWSRELEATLEISERVLRHLLVKLNS